MSQAMSSGKMSEELQLVLNEEIRLYEKYGEFLSKDSDLMVEMNIDALEASNKAKETIVLKVHALEQARQQLISRMAQEKGISSERVRLQDLCTHFSASESQKILALRSRLIELVESLKKTQSDTNALARSSLTWIEGAMGTLKNLLSPSGTYNARGRVGKANLFAGHVVESKV